MSSLKKNLGYNILLTISNMIFPIVTFPYISRVLGPEGTGAVNFSQNFCQYFIMFSAIGIPIYGIREIAKLKDDKVNRSKTFFEISIIRIISTLIVLVPYFIIIIHVHKFSGFLNMYYWGAFFIFINIFSIEWFFTGLESFKFITTRTITIKALSVIFLFTFVKNRNDILPYFLIIVFTLFINSVVNLKYALNYLTLKVSWRQLELKKHLSPLLLIMGSSVAMSIYLYLDTMMLGFLANDKAVGFYSASMRITKICLSIITSLGQVLVPRLSHAVTTKNDEEVKRLLTQSVNFVFAIGTPMMVGLYVLAPELIVIFSGKEFLPAVITMQILSPLVLVIGLAHVFSVQVLIPLSKDKQLLAISIIGSLLSVGLNFVLIPYFNGNGAAITNIITELVITIMAFLVARKSIKVMISLKELSKNLVATFPIFLLAYSARLLFGQPLEVVLFTFLASVSIFFVCQLIFFKNQMAANIYRAFTRQIVLVFSNFSKNTVVR